MPHDSPRLKQFLDTTAEPLLKLGTAGLGALYVFGVLVSNLHLMAVGVSEFTSLRAQNVMTGSLTMFYIVSLLLLAIPWSLAACICGITICSNQDRVPDKVGRCMGVLGIAALFWLSIALAAGLVWGFLYPWGRPWDASLLHSTWKATLDDVAVVVRQFIESFGTRKIVVAFLAFSLVLTYWLIKVDAARHFGASQKSLGPDRAYLIEVTLRQGAAAMPSLALMAVVCAVVGFANDVYPNIRANLGGGQPDVVELQIGVDDATKINLPPDFAPQTPAQPGSPTHVGPVVIWYQSDKFLYLAPFVQNDRASERLLAIDIKMVRLVRYIPASVRISGRKIVEIHME